MSTDTDRAVARIEGQLRRIGSEPETEPRPELPWADSESNAALEIPRRCAAVTLRNSADRLNAVWTFRRADADESSAAPDGDGDAGGVWRVPLGYRQSQVIFLEAGLWRATLRAGLPGVGSSATETRELRVARGQAYDSILTTDLEQELRKPLEALKRGRMLPKGVDERVVHPSEKP